jgi:hypothetical protein
VSEDDDVVNPAVVIGISGRKKAWAYVSSFSVRPWLRGAGDTESERCRGPARDS